MFDNWQTVSPEIEVLHFLSTVTLKPIFLIFLLGYVLFSLLVVRQVRLLTRTLGTALSSVLKTTAIINTILSLFILVLVLLSF